MEILRECGQCGASEERVWEDSFTGIELCHMCLGVILGRLTMSPYTEGDNMEELLLEES